MEEALTALALRRAGAENLRAFQKKFALTPGEETEAALTPYLVGYDLYRIAPGDTYGAIAARFGATVRAILAANPGQNPTELLPGQVVVVPLPFPVVPTDVPFTSRLLHYAVRGLQARYPFLLAETIATTARGRRVTQLRLGTGGRRVYYNAAHHANEWITTPLLLRLLENYAAAVAFGEPFDGVDAQTLAAQASLYVVPMVNPDGVDLVTGGVSQEERQEAAAIAADYPDIPFPDGWKANLNGVDLNLNYPARWEEAREIKFAQGYTGPAPRDFVGGAPLDQRESRAMFDQTEKISPDVVIAWHTQGKEIYWKFLDLEPPGAEALGQAFSRESGYDLENVPYASGFAGYKDWFIQDFNLPGYTIEAGEGENPLPLSQFDAIYRDNLPIFRLGLAGVPVAGAVG